MGNTCKFTVKNKEGEFVESILYQELEDFYLPKVSDPLEIERLYYQVSRATKEGTRIYDNPDLENFIEGLTIEDVYDKNGQLKSELAIKFLKEKKIGQEVPQPLGANILSRSKWQTKARELTSNLSKRIAYLKTKKFKTREKSELQRLLKQLLEVEKDHEYLKGLDNYIEKASKEILDLIEVLNKKGLKNLNAKDLQEMDNVIRNYDNIPELLTDVEEDLRRISLGVEDPSTVIEIGDVMLTRLQSLEKSYKTLAKNYRGTAIKIAVKMFLSMQNPMLEALKEEVRTAFLKTDEGQRKEKEKKFDYERRVQKTVDELIIDKHLYDEAQTELFLESLFRTGDDISWISRWALQGGNTSSTLLRTLNAMILKSENNSKNMYNSKMAELDPLYKEYRKYMKEKGKSTNSVLELYENINEVDEDGMATGYYTGKTSSLWTRQKAQINKYTNAYVKHLQELESKNLSDTPKFWDEDLNEAVREEDRERIKALRKAQKGELNKRYNEEKDLADRYDKLVGIAKELSKNKKEFRKLIKEFRALKNKTSEAAHKKSLKLEENRKVGYRLQDSYTGYKNEYEFEIFKRHYDVVSLPNINALNGISKKDREYLREGKSFNGEEAKHTLKVLIPEDVSYYLSNQFKNLDRLRREDPDNIEWRYYKAVMNTVAVSERKYSEAYRTYFKKPEVRKTGAERWTDDVDSFLNFNQIFKNYIKPSIKEGALVVAGQDYDLSYSNTFGYGVLENGYKISKATKELPVYLKETGMDPQDQSSNIQHVVLAGFNNAVAYQEKFNILPMVEVYLYLLETRKTTKKSASYKLMNAIHKAAGKAFLDTEAYMERATEEPGRSDKSRLYNNALDMVNTRLFGESVNSTLNINIPLTILGRPDLAINLRKLARLFSSYVSTTVLSLNVKSGAANVIYGEFQYLQEVLGNEYISEKSWGFSQLDYMLDIKGIISDIGKDYPTSKMNLLGLIFDPLNDYNPLESNYKYTNKAYAVFNMNSLHGINNMGEHIMQFGTMGGILRETKVLDKDGNYLTKNSTTKDRNKAMSLFEAFEKTSMAEDSFEMVTDKRIAAIEIKKGTRLEKMPFVGGNLYAHNTLKKNYEINKRALNTLTNLIQSLNEEMHGPYSWRTAPPMKRTFLGGLLLQMRQWFPTGFSARWASFTNELQDMVIALASRDGEHFRRLRERSMVAKYFDQNNWGDFINMGPDQKFDPKRMGWTGGRNVSVLRHFEIFTYHVFQAFKRLLGKNLNDAEFQKHGFLSMTKRQWNTMSDRDKANIKKVTMAYGARMLLSGFAAMLLAGDDDDEKFFKLAFYTTRLHTELSAYSSPTELARLLQSPAVTVSMYNRIIDLTIQLINDMQEGEPQVYQSGLRKGTTKRGKLIRALLPWGNVLQQHKYIEDILNYHYKDQAGLVK